MGISMSCCQRTNVKFTKHQFPKQQKQFLSSSERFFWTKFFPSFFILWDAYTFKQKNKDNWNVKLFQVPNGGIFAIVFVPKTWNKLLYNFEDMTLAF